MRLYFHIRTANALYLDPDGEDHDDLDTARIEAIACVRELMDDIWLGQSPVDRQFELTDDAGEILLIVPFTEAN